MVRSKLFLSIFFLVISISFVSATCSIDMTLINQDPSFATPGEYVDVLIQVEGVEDPSCGLVTIEFLEDYPFSIDSGNSIFQLDSGTYVKDVNSFLKLPYKVRVDSDALDGDQGLKIKVSSNGGTQISRIYDFNISVEDVKTEFITTIDSYSFSSNQLVLGLINIGDEDARAITVEIPQQDNILVDGGNIKILGDLDSNEDTTLSFSAIPKDGEITIIISYNDPTNNRRTIYQKVIFKEKPFESTKEKSSLTLSTFFLWICILGIISYLFWIRHKRKKSFIDKFSK